MSETDSSPDVVSSDDDGSSDSVEIIVDNTDGPHPDAAESAGADSCDSDSSDDDEGSDGNGVDVVTKSVNVSNIDPLQANNGLRIAAGKVSQTLDFRFAIPKSQIAKTAMTTWEAEREYHRSMCRTGRESTEQNRSTHIEEIRTAPLFTAEVLRRVLKQKANPDLAGKLLPQYGFLGRVLGVFGGQKSSHLPGVTPEPHKIISHHVVEDPSQPDQEKPGDDRLMVNMNAPWSAFICGSQGSGKSHTLSCMLENALVQGGMAKLPNKLAGIVFHYDKITSVSSTQVCEAAYLASEIPVKVLVSPTNYTRMKQAYENLSGLPEGTAKPKVVSFLLHEKHLNVERMLKLMAVDEKEGKMALYMESVRKVLRAIALQDQGDEGLDFAAFTKRLNSETLNEGQKAMLHTRLQLLESFMWFPEKAGDIRRAKPQFSKSKKGKAEESKWIEEEDARVRAKMGNLSAWSFEPGSLTIVDLSCPFVDEGTACALFNICLPLFLKDRAQAGRIVALDEAHKFMTASDSSSEFTETLLSIIRLQRHYATRVIIATQEPTISPALLDLSSMTVVHRFTSRTWMTALKSHLAGVIGDGESSKGNVEEIFQRIVNLDAGQALVFSPSTMLGPEDSSDPSTMRMRKLGTGYLQLQVRKRVTIDGGRSILAV